MFPMIFKVSELNNLRNDLRQLMEIAQQLEPYVRSSELENPRSIKSSAADLLSSNKSYSNNQQFAYSSKTEPFRKHQSDAMEFSSGSQFSSSAPMASNDGSGPVELSEEYKRRSV